jgi:16S rRNA (uracil1498-N3)-methyltransferase
MDCIYNKFLENEKSVILTNESLQHLNALRIRIGESILITNGLGLTVLCSLISINKKSAELDIIEIYENMGESNSRLGLALGILDNRDRFEFALEKSIELGLTDFYPLISKYSSTKKYDINRLIQKSIATICQSKRSVLPVIHKPILLENLLANESLNYESIFLADIDGMSINEKMIKNSNLVIAGPEGGLSTEEILKIRSLENTQSIKLGTRRLRAETASIILLSAVSLNFHN